MASLALASEKARSSACGLEARGENLKGSSVENLILWERYRAVWHSGFYLLCDAEQVCSCSGPLHYHIGGEGTHQESLKDKILSDEVKLVKAAPVLFTKKMWHACDTV